MSSPKACKDCKYSRGTSYYPTCMHKSAKQGYYSLMIGKVYAQGSAETNRNSGSCGGDAKHYQPSLYKRLCEFINRALNSQER